MSGVLGITRAQGRPWTRLVSGSPAVFPQTPALSIPMRGLSGPVPRPRHRPGRRWPRDRPSAPRPAGPALARGPVKERPQGRVARRPRPPDPGGVPAVPASAECTPDPPAHAIVGHRRSPPSNADECRRGYPSSPADRQPSSKSCSGSSTSCFTVTRNRTASDPSTIRWS